MRCATTGHRAASRTRGTIPALPRRRRLGEPQHSRRDLRLAAPCQGFLIVQARILPVALRFGGSRACRTDAERRHRHWVHRGHRTAASPYSEWYVELLKTFVDQAVIAIENAV